MTTPSGRKVMAGEERKKENLCRIYWGEWNQLSKQIQTLFIRGRQIRSRIHVPIIGDSLSSQGLSKERRKKERKKERGLIPTIVAYLSCSSGRTHFTRTNLVRIKEHICVNIKL
jgi:hypothetical protein